MPLRSSKKDNFCYDHYILEARLPTQNWQKKKQTKKNLTIFLPPPGKFQYIVFIST